MEIKKALTQVQVSELLPIGAGVGKNKSTMPLRQAMADICMNSRRTFGDSGCGLENHLTETSLPVRMLFEFSV